MELSQQASDLGPVQLFQQQILQKRGDRGIQFQTVAEVAGGCEQRANVPGGVKDFGNATVDIQQSVNCFHGCADGVFGGEDAVALAGFSELADEGEVGSGGRYDIRTISGLSRHKECGDVGHHDGYCGGAGGCQFAYFTRGNSEVIQPFPGDFLACAVLHGFVDIIAGFVDEESVEPCDDLMRGLLSEVWLAIDGPAQQPCGIPHRHDPPCDNLPAERIAAGNSANVPGNASVERGDSGRFPFGPGYARGKDFRSAEGRVSCGNASPEIPRGCRAFVQAGRVAVISLI